MQQGQPPSPARAAVFFTTLLLAGVGLSTVPRILPGLAGVAVRQLSMFVGISLLFAAFAEARPLRDVFRLRWLSLAGVLKSLFLGVVSWGLVYLLGSLVITLVQALGGKMYQPYPELQHTPFVVAMLVAGLLPALCEEFAFRGYVQYGLGPLGPRAAVLLTGLLFGLLHFSLVRLLPLALLGMIFAAAVQRVGSILPGMIMHFVNNGIVLGLSYGLRDAGSSGGDAGLPAPSGISLLFMAGAVITLGLIVRAMVQSFGPGDLARPAEAAPPPQPESQERRRWAPVVLALLPAMMLYAWAAANELYMVFGPR